jgi:hypothetical protein|nr:MAG TPA: YopX protein [Caudoviricetes sp.]
MTPKFRAWHNELGRMMSISDMWFNVDSLGEIGLNDAVMNDYITVSPDEIKLMQSTGLKDKNGKEIFEGDILGTKDGLLNGIIEYREDLGMFVNSLIRYNNFERLCNVANDREIIGNIHENPELLEVEE